eukprot:gene32357-48295_t
MPAVPHPADGGVVASVGEGAAADADAGVRLIRSLCEWWMRAMDRGWVAEWVDAALTDDCALVDRPAILAYYNKILTHLLPGDPCVRWEVREVTATGVGSVTARHD